MYDNEDDDNVYEHSDDDDSNGDGDGDERWFSGWQGGGSTLGTDLLAHDFFPTIMMMIMVILAILTILHACNMKLDLTAFSKITNFGFCMS